MGAKEFLMPNLKKVFAFVVTYVVLTSIMLCVHSEFFCNQIPNAWAGCTCTNALNTVSVYPAKFLSLMTLGLFEPAGYFGLLWLSAILSYLLACVVAYLW